MLNAEIVKRIQKINIGIERFSNEENTRTPFFSHDYAVLKK